VFVELNVETFKMQALISVSAWKHPLYVVYKRATKVVIQK
jgi:hypothetical protein